MSKIESIARKRKMKCIKVKSSINATEFYKELGFKKSTGLVKAKNGMVYQPMIKYLT